MSRLITASTAVAIVVVLSWAAAGFLDQTPASAATATHDLGELTRVIGVYEARTTDHTDPLDYRTLGRYYLDRAQLTGSIADYRSALGAFETSVDLAPTVAEGKLGLAAAASALHDFPTALQHALDVTANDATNAAAWLIAGDAYLELGDLDAAEGAFGYAPGGDPAVIVRYAELAHLRGRQSEAIRLAASATDQARRLRMSGRALGFHLLFESDLRFDDGQYDRALGLSREAQALDPSWAIAHAAEAKALLALHNFQAADDAFASALELQPGDPEWLTGRADIASLRGDVSTADALYEEAERVYDGEDRRIYGRSLAALWAGQGVNLEAALTLAEADLAARQDIGAYDTYAWTLYRLGRYEEAAEAANIATRYGTRDGELLFHAALISAAAGDVDRAADLLADLIATNPEFHPIDAQTAVQTLRALTE